MSRAFAAGAFEFAVVTSDVDDHHVVEALFRDLPPPRSNRTDLAIFALNRTGGIEDTWLVEGPFVEDHAPSALRVALDRIVAAVNGGALEAESEHLHLHAAAAAIDERAVVLAGRWNTGKSTTIAHLVARGWGYVTDEAVRLADGTSRVAGFPKPVSVKAGGRHLLSHLEPWMIPVNESTDSSCFVPIGATGAAVVDGGDPHVVIVLRRTADADSAADSTAYRLHAADAVVALMEETLDAPRFGRAAERLARLAAASHCFELEIGTPSNTVDTIEGLFGLDPAEPLEVSVLPKSEAFSAGVVSVAIGDRAVVHEVVSGVIFALDAGGTRVWKALGGWTDDDDIDVDGPAIKPFVAQLGALGVLAGAA
jgi:hypothetical protein